MLSIYLSSGWRIRMINLLHERLTRFEGTDDAKLNYVREFLQLLTLKILEEKGHYKNISFLGGTALRILFDLNRFSEDLDFSLADPLNYDFDKIVTDIHTNYTLYNIPVEIKARNRGSVASAYIKFTSLLYQFGLSPHKDQRFTIKFDIDQNPPHGAQTMQTIINKDFIIGINHYNLPSLFAGKLHAILHRSYTKGRDFYDLLWYISKNIEPNLELLNNAIFQSQGKNPHLDLESLKLELQKRIEETNFSHVLSDLTPFLITPNEASYFTKEHFTNLISQMLINE